MKLLHPLAALACAALAAFSQPVNAAPGDPDLTFGGTGRVTRSLSGFDDGAYSVAIQSDGKIVLAGYVDGGPIAAPRGSLIARFTSNGTLDASFSVGTTPTFQGFFAAKSIVIQNDGKLIAGGGSTGGSELGVARYNVNGSLDTTFNGTGKLTGSGFANVLAIDNNQKLVIAGRVSGASLARYNIDGSMDATFNATGVPTADFVAFSMAIQNDGKIVVAGSGSGGGTLVRYNVNGSLDTSFNPTGILNASSVAIQGGGKIVAAGVSNGIPSIGRYNSDGSFDITFGNGGMVTVGYGNVSRLCMQNDGRIVVGIGNGFLLARYNVNGTLDTSFGDGGKVDDQSSPNALAKGMAIQSDGKIIVAGFVRAGSFGSYNDTTLARYEGRGLTITASQTTNIGSSFTFSIIAHDPDPLSYQWFKDGVAILGATAPSYTIAAAQPWHVGEYSLIATHADGIRISNSSLLEINGVPTSVWRGLVVFYPFDGNAQDREPGAAHATVSGATITMDRFRQPNRAFDFDGVNDQMTATVPNLPVGSASRTISLWAKSRPDPARSVGLVEWGLAQNGQAFGIANSGSPYTWNGKTYGVGNGVDSGIVVDSKWHHVCLTYESGILSIFLDGVLKQTKSEAINTGLSALTMGVGVGASTFYPGSLDEVRIYNRALSPSDIQLLNSVEDPDTDGDGIRDRFETGTGIYVSPEDTGTSPTNPDSDGDGLNDGDELNTHHSNPNVKDTDGDGFDDGFEVTTGFSPTSAASTPDALSSIRTAAEYRFNAALGISYRIEASTDFTNWTTIETNIIGAGGVMTRFYSIEGQPRRFFRSRRN